MANPGLIHQVHVADGFADDCDELVHRCSKMKTLTFDTFCDVWKDMNMSSMYQGREISAELAELSEEVIHIAKRYLVANTSNFEIERLHVVFDWHKNNIKGTVLHVLGPGISKTSFNTNNWTSIMQESVTGLFLVYALQNLQPFSGFAALRLVPEDMPAIYRLQLVARRERRLDVLYILGAVLIRGPTQYHAEEREYGMEPALRKYIEGYTGIDRRGVRPKGVFYRQNEELDMIRELNNLTRLYTEAKAKITDANGGEDRNLQYTDQNLPTELDTSLKKIINGIIDEEEHKEPEERSATIREIKNRAMTNTIDPMNHLTSKVTRRRGKKETSPKRKEKAGRKSKKEQKESPKKAKSPSKRKASPKKRSKPKKKKKSASSDSEEDLKSSSDNSQDNELINNDLILLNTDNFHKEKVQALPLDLDAIEPNETNPNEIGQLNEKQIDIQIDSVPIYIRTEESGIEIQIIDQYDGGDEVDDDDEEQKRINVKTKIRELPGITLKRVSSSVGESSEQYTPKSGESMASMTMVNDDYNFKKPFPHYTLKKIEKRCQKKPILKSKFKRMGMLPVANFASFEDEQRENL